MDRITRLRIKNVRAIESLELELGRPLTVLIGENGAGKSTILECLELLRQVGDRDFMRRFHIVHRGSTGMLRSGATSLELGVTIEDDEGVEPTLSYNLAILSDGTKVVIEREELESRRLDGSEEAKEVVWRVAGEAQVVGVPAPQGSILGHPVASDETALSTFRHVSAHPALARVRAALEGIEVQLGFDVRASWSARGFQLPESIRSGATLFPAEHLELGGRNLANAWAELNNRSSDEAGRALELVRLGLGEEVDRVVTRPDPGGGNLHLGLRFRGRNDVIPAGNLSDGQLSWLGFVALALLGRGRSLLAVDEPEKHLHPALLGRVMSLLIDTADSCQVLLATHSDRVLELLEDPAKAVRVCSLDGGRVRVDAFDPAKLADWLKEYGDLAELRRSGYLKRALAADDEVAAS